eukprot:TRINITY_DN9525_c0_g1_i2.p4 TRINITY_DN9525_c0_g1~~TRINITY_DN9525_c0_g1_i2.p4  ORF type:complete len:102 (-),score=3.63 TRINITY_DN9525_c0_g1_i2:297-602(-)
MHAYVKKSVLVRQRLLLRENVLQLVNFDIFRCFIKDNVVQNKIINFTNEIWQFSLFLDGFFQDNIQKKVLLLAMKFVSFRYFQMFFNDVDRKMLIFYINKK